MKILFIHPDLGEIDPKGKKKRKAIFPPLSLGVLAGMTPSDVGVQLIDDKLEQIPYDTDADLVAITVMTAAAPRAYQIADQFRKQGKRVVLGGMHPTALPDEAGQYADVVGIGEAEGFWPKLVEDARGGELKSRYGPCERQNPFWTPPARSDLFGDRYRLKNMVQTTRGCPFRCNFCSVSKFFGRTYRFRHIPDILNELKQYRDQMVGFVDDNIMGMGHHKRAKELFRAIIKADLNIKWISQGSVDMARDEELLELAKESGCVGIFIGFESLMEENIKAIGKNVNRIEDYEKVIKTIHSYGIAIEGAFIFGLDGDDKTVFERTVKFAKRMKLAAAQFGVLTPFPGTDLYHKLMSEKRIFDFDWSHYDIGHAVFKPKKMDARTLEEETKRAWRDFYTIPSIAKRLLFSETPFGLFPWVLNIAFRRSIRWSQSHPRGSLALPTEEVEA